MLLVKTLCQLDAFRLLTVCAKMSTSLGTYYSFQTNSAQICDTFISTFFFQILTFDLVFILYYFVPVILFLFCLLSVFFFCIRIVLCCICVFVVV